MKRKYGDGLYYLRKNREVDFYIPESKSMIQVAYNPMQSETETREIKAMMSLTQNVETEHMTIVTLDIEKQVQSGAYLIQFIPVWKWLLLST